jgi:lantibiotic modifying enzyme
MLEGLGACEFSARRGIPLAKLCAAGADYGWGELERVAGSDLIAQTLAKARINLRRQLQKSLERITRPCFDLEWKSFELAMNSLGLAPSNPALTERMFLRDRPDHRLFLLFQKFPVLANLWCLRIRQWRDHVVEVLQRAAKDDHALSRWNIREPINGVIKDIRLGLSDPHHGGRSVTLIEFNGGRRVVYKPRPGTSEAAWFSFLAWMNRNGFRPRLRVPRILPRNGYCWMEYVETAPCQNKAAVRRFYERLGGLIAAAYLMKAVDCHRQNVIAAGEHPVLVDIDALWHVSRLTKTQSPEDVLYRTGFLPNAKPRSLQSRSSVLGRAAAGPHLPMIAGKPVFAAHYTSHIDTGFRRAWSCIIGTKDRRAEFLRHVRKVRTQRRRWIYRATEGYGAILQGSLQPAVLRSQAARDEFIADSSLPRAPSRTVGNAEISAIRQLDLPYFVRRTNHAMPADENSPPSELTEAIRRSLGSD